MNSLLVLDQIHSYYGKAKVLHGLSLEVNRGEVVSLIGRNGVGKSTTLKSIMGLVDIKEGGVYINGQRIDHSNPHSVLKKHRISYVPEERRIYSSLTVKENLLLGEFSLSKDTRKSRKWNLDRVYSTFPILKEYENKRGTYLSGGEQQMLAIGRGLMGEPSILLLDEPCEGLAPIIVQDLVRAVQFLYEEGISIVIAEQSLRLTKVFTSRQYILNKGEVVFTGTSDDLRENEEVVNQYLSV